MKELSRTELATVKRTAANVKTFRAKKAKLEAQKAKIDAELESVNKSIDLFAGPGGLCTGFKWAGIRPLIAIEWSYWTVQTYSASHDADVFELENYLNGSMQEVDNYFKPNENTLLIYGDINKVDNELEKI